MAKKVLIVDDEKTTVLLLEKFIQDIGHTIITASTAEQAMVETANSNPDIVLMDIVLSGETDGIEAAKQINELYQIPVIYITSSSDIPTLNRALTTNPSGYIVKPVDKKELQSAINMTLLRHDMEKKIRENELRFFTILNSIGDAVLVVDDSDCITYVNPVAERIIEQSIDKIIGKKYDEIINFNYYGLPTTDNDNLDSVSYYYLTSHSGKKIPVNFSVSAIKDIHGVQTGSVIIFRDDTDRVNFELKLNESFNQIKKGINSIVQAMAQTLEMRDSYTAGHQRRVAGLARFIAEEMCLPDIDIQGIFMASTIHDLGKISIPIEILNKPGQLSTIEFDLMKTHPVTGFDILKSFEFPWPLADMVHQHHERMNGSGYPHGLSGSNILLGARIICVADVVEAMASDRPYRPSLGLDAALAEISNNKGILYDRDVAEICEKIFIEKKYQMQ